MKQCKRWMYVVVGVLVLLLVGMIYAWSVISQSIAAAFPQWSMAQLSLTFTITMAMFCIGGLIAGILSKRIKPRWYVIGGAVLLLEGFILSSMTETLLLLYLGFGVLCGLGAGLAYNAVMSTMSAWFPDKQGLISGILLMGFGLSSFFFIKPEKDLRISNLTVQKEIRQPALDIDSKQMVRQPSFWLYYIWAIVISAAGLVLVSQASGIATQVGTGISDGNIATVVGLISILNGIGRVIFGALFDRKGYCLTMILDMIIFASAALLLILALSTNQFLFIILGFVVGGFAYGGVTPTNSAIISDFFGRSNYPMNFSLINTNLIIASLASTIAGKLYDASQSYMSTIFLMIGVIIIGFVVFLGIRRPVQKEKADI